MPYCSFTPNFEWIKKADLTLEDVLLENFEEDKAKKILSDVVFKYKLLFPIKLTSFRIAGLEGLNEKGEVASNDEKRFSYCFSFERRYIDKAGYEQIETFIHAFN